MSNQTNLIFKPARIGKLRIRNRIIRGAQWTNLALSNGLPCHLFDLEKLADAKVGLIISGFTYPSQQGRARMTQLGLCSPRQVIDWAPSIKRMHYAGAKFFFQVSHCGEWKHGILRKKGEILPGPSKVNERTREMTTDEIYGVIDEMKRSAMLAESADADGIQINAGHGYLYSQFLSPLFNKRTDKWGGSVENRARFLQETIDAIRKSVSPKFVISVKINGHDCLDGGVDPEMAAKYINFIDADNFEITSGLCNLMTSIRSSPDKDSLLRQVKKDDIGRVLRKASMTVPGFEFVENYNLPYLKEIRKIVGPQKNLTCGGGVRDFDVMQKLIKDGTANFISMVRPFIRQPHLLQDYWGGYIKYSKCNSCGECTIKYPKTEVCCTYSAFSRK